MILESTTGLITLYNPMIYYHHVEIWHDITIVIIWGNQFELVLTTVL